MHKMIKASSVQTPTSSQNLPHEAFFPTVYTDHGVDTARTSPSPLGEAEP